MTCDNCIKLQDQIIKLSGENIDLHKRISTQDRQIANQNERILIQDRKIEEYGENIGEYGKNIEEIGKDIEELKKSINQLQTNQQQLIVGQIVFTFCELLAEYEEKDCDEYFFMKYSDLKKEFSHNKALLKYFPTFTDTQGDIIFRKCRANRRDIAYPDILDSNVITKEALYVLVKRKLGSQGNNATQLLDSIFQLRDTLNN